MTRTNHKPNIKTLLLTTLLVLSTMPIFAQSETVTIGTGSSTTTYAPFCNYYTYGRSASIYTSSEIGQAGWIDQIEWYCNSSNQTVTCSELKIYLTTTTNTTFGNSKSFPTSATNVYSRTTSMTVGGDAGWKQFQLDTPFYYDGSSNLIVIVTAKTARYNTSLTWRYTASSNTTVYYGDDSSSSYGEFGTNAITSRTNNRPNIRLTFKKKFYFSATATPSPSAGGTASVSLADTELMTAYTNTSATTNATFSATANDSYRFLGWSQTANGNIISTGNPYTTSITSTSTNSNSPTNTTLYARFQEMPNPQSITSESAVTVYVGSPLAVNYQLTPADAYDHVAAASSNSNIFTVPNWVNNGNVIITPVTVGQATLTLTAYKLNNTTVSPSYNTTVTVRDIVATPVISYNPTVADNGQTATASILCSTPGTTIYYTVNGVDPTGLSTQVYGNPFLVSDGDVIKVIAIKTTDGTYWDNSALETQTYRACSTEKPIITYTASGSNVTVTISSEPGSTIYYTTNGNNPTSNSTNATSPVVLNNIASGVTIKAYAKNGNCSASEIVSKEIITSGTNDTIVTLYDIEDHSWSYYSDGTLPQQLRSLNPVDVKITYYGNGADNISTTTGTTPSSSSWTEDASGVKVGPNDNYNTFVYYKTLERLDGSTSDNPEGLCAYTTIPNPFSVRPTYEYATGALNKYCGFYMWRIKDIKNGKIYDSNDSRKEKWTDGNVTTANMLYAGSTYYFAPDNEYGMEVELEALWARAFVTTGSSNMGTYASGTNAYERNFHVVTSSNQTASNYQKGYPATISSYYPDGTSGGGSFSAGDFKASAETKIEYISIGTSSSNTWSANGYDFIIGRGVTGTVGTLYGLSAASTSSFNMRIESGTFNKLYFLGEARNFTNDAVLTTTLGCDYDRAQVANGQTSYNNLLHIANDIAIGTNATIGRSDNPGAEVFNCTVKSGNFDLGTSNYGGGYQFYLSAWGNQGTPYTYGKRTLIVEGGIFSDISGGMETENVVANSVQMVDIRIKGGTVNSIVYGAAQYSSAVGGRRMVFTGGNIKGWIAGGCNGTQTEGGELYGDVYIYFGGTAQVGDQNGGTHVGGNTSYTKSGRTYYGINGADGGSIFGAGCGINPTNSSYQPNGNYQSTTVGRVDNSTIVIADESIVWRDLYGGGNFGWVRANGGSSITILGGTVKGQVFGGSNNQQGQTVNISMKGGSVQQGLFGGSNSWGTINNNVTLTINGGSIQGGLYGGGNGTTSTACDITGSTSLTISGGTISGGVYGGGNTRSTIGQGVTISMTGGTINGGLFGGGNGVDNNNCNCSITGTTSISISGGTINDGVYGGGNTYSTISQGTTLNITGGRINGKIFGGGNGIDARDCSIGGSTLINYSNATTTQGIYGGGNTYSTISGDATLNITSGNIGLDTNNKGYIHGGGYGNKTRVLGSISLTIGSVGNPGPTIFGDIYGGSAQGKTNGNSSLTSGKSTTVLFNSGTLNGSLYGGGLGNATYEADVYGPVTVTVNGGKITGAVFGCNNVKGTPKSTVSVTINGTDNVATGYALNEVYGGGNQANYVPGSGVSGYPKVEVTGCSNSIEYVYGGGNAADVPSTDVTIWGGRIGHVFGGGHGNKTANPQTEANVSGNVAVKIYGGTIGEVFAGSNSKGSINGNSCQVTIENQGSCDMSITDVYGGGNQADGKAGTLSIGCGAVITGNIYGGAKNAAITNDITLEITGGNLHNVFGGNNMGGDVSGTITVNIDKAANCSTWHIDTVYGGGNLADYKAPVATPNYPQVNIKNGAISANVFGGGLGQDAEVTGNPRVNITGGTIAGNVYGGGEAAPVTGSPVLSASGANTSADHLYGGGKGSTAIVTGSTQVTVSGGTYAYVFGGGEAADMSGSVTVNIQGGTITEDVYGGGALAHTNTANQSGNVITPKTNTTTVNLTGGTVKNVYGGGLGNAQTEAKVYGDVLVNLNRGVSSSSKGAVVTGSIFGCNNINGTPLGSATVYIAGTQNSGLGTMLAKNNDSYDIPAVYGGGNMAAYIPYADTASTHVIINACRTASIDYVYGGGNAAPVPATQVEIYGSYMIGSLFGGGNGKDSIVVNGVKEANPGADVGIYKVSQSTFDATAQNLRYSDPGQLKGDNKYILYGDTTGTSIIGTTHVTFYGGIVHHLFGGSNTMGDIIKQSTVILGDEDLKSCDFSVDDVYGGSNEAYMSGSAHIDMNCIDGMEEIYGGSKKADVSKNIVLNVTGGKYGKVFGGNNIGGRIFGSITVNIEQSGCLPIVIDELYGGGNQAPYSVYGYTGNTPNSEGTQLYADPVVNIVSCDTIHKVFGGGLGESAIVYGSPYVNINLVRGWTNGDYKGSNKQNDPHSAYILNKVISNNIGVIDTVFGGGNRAVVVGQTHVNIGTESTVKVHNVSKAVYNAIKNTVPGITNPGFAGNDGDAVTKDLTIQVQGVNITGNVYGGGNNANVTGETHVQIGPE